MVSQERDWKFLEKPLSMLWQAEACGGVICTRTSRPCLDVQGGLCGGNAAGNRITSEFWLNHLKEIRKSLGKSKYPFDSSSAEHLSVFLFGRERVVLNLFGGFLNLG